MLNYNYIILYNLSKIKHILSVSNGNNHILYVEYKILMLFCYSVFSISNKHYQIITYSEVFVTYPY